MKGTVHTVCMFTRTHFPLSARVRMHARARTQTTGCTSTSEGARLLLCHLLAFLLFSLPFSHPHSPARPPCTRLGAGLLRSASCSRGAAQLIVSHAPGAQPCPDSSRDLKSTCRAFLPAVQSAGGACGQPRDRERRWDAEQRRSEPGSPAPRSYPPGLGRGLGLARPGRRSCAGRC